MPKKWFDEYLNRTGEEEWVAEIWGHFVCPCCEYPTRSDLSESDSEKLELSFCPLCGWLEYSGSSLEYAQKKFSDQRKSFSPLLPDDNKVTKSEKISAKKHELITFFESLKESKAPAVSKTAAKEISDKIKELEKLEGYA